MPAFHSPKKDDKSGAFDGAPAKGGALGSAPQDGSSASGSHQGPGGHDQGSNIPNPKPSTSKNDQDNHTQTTLPNATSNFGGKGKGKKKGKGKWSSDDGDSDSGSDSGSDGNDGGDDVDNGSSSRKTSSTIAEQTPAPAPPPAAGSDSFGAAKGLPSLGTDTGNNGPPIRNHQPSQTTTVLSTQSPDTSTKSTSATDSTSKPHTRHSRTRTESTSTTISEDSSTATSQAYSETISITSIFTPGPTTSLESTSLPIQTSTGIEADTYSIDSTATYTPTSTSTSSPTPGISGTNSHATSNGTALPTYAIPLIVLAALITLAFLAALAVFGLKERRRKQQSLNGQRTPEAGPGGASSGTGAKKPSYLRAVGKAAGLATGVSGILWLAKKLSGRSEEEKRKREYLEDVVVYAKLRGNREEHESDSEKEMEVEMGSGGTAGGGQAIERGRGRERERGLDAASQRSESMVVMNAALGYTPAPAPALISVTSPLKRSPSMVSSLSSSTRSQGQYERLIPSPVTDEAPYVWSPPPVPAVPSNIQGGGLRNSGAGTGDRRRSLVPAVLRPGGG
ncbi:hypothetical protein F5Y02DRAFT_429556 [Annulohypoxylon stygium]|nr:hypothetical protein F5Y02DRAFT_429556 [Annulohypoxylon stygium]